MNIIKVQNTDVSDLIYGPNGIANPFNPGSPFSIYGHDSEQREETQSQPPAPCDDKCQEQRDVVAGYVLAILLIVTTIIGLIRIVKAFK